ncbi:MAG: hypothetical protein AAGI03_02805 [Pseudomonadota bacterium]
MTTTSLGLISRALACCFFSVFALVSCEEDRPNKQAEFNTPGFEVAGNDVCGLSSMGVSEESKSDLESYFYSSVDKDLSAPSDEACSGLYCIQERSNDFQMGLRVYYPVRREEKVFLLFRCVNSRLISENAKAKCDLLFDYGPRELGHGWIDHKVDIKELLRVAICLDVSRQGGIERGD